MKISLTFDNGPSIVTDDILRTLDKHSVRATFFVVGTQLATSDAPARLQSISSAGHSIGNHSYTHTVPLGLCSEIDAVSEIERTDLLLSSLGHPTHLFRPFGGGGAINNKLLHTASVDYMLRQKMTCVTWNCVPRDWEQPDSWLAVALDHVSTHDWSVVVLHDLPGCGSQHVDEFIIRARQLGGTFVTEFPDECTPIRRGIASGQLASITNT